MSNTVLTPSSAETATPSSRAALPSRRVVVLGVPITDVSMEEAIRLVVQRIAAPQPVPLSIFFVNAHTLNLASRDLAFRQTLLGGDYVFGDGTGVRWASALQGSRLCDNVNGTDFTPKLLSHECSPRRSYFMLGADRDTIQVAAAAARDRFPLWDQAGFHHGYVHTPDATDAVIEKINLARPDLLLVGMGNPLQEQWISQNQARIKTAVCMGIGGLFDFWSGNCSRAPQWLRKVGHEWAWRLWQQPGGKAKRYLVGNPLYLARAVKSCRRDRLDTAHLNAGLRGPLGKQR